MPDFRSYCIQFITNRAVYQLAFRAALGAHTVAGILGRFPELLRSGGDGTAEAYLDVIRAYMAEFSLPCDRLSGCRYPADPEEIWDLPGDMGYPARKAIEPWLENLGSPDELHQLIVLREDAWDEAGELESMRSCIAAVKAVKDPSGGCRVKIIQQYASFHVDDTAVERALADRFTIAQYHSRCERRREAVGEYTLAVSPYASDPIRLLIHIDELQTARQAGSLFGCGG